MKRTLRRIATVTLITSTVLASLTVGGVAMANQSAPAAPAPQSGKPAASSHAAADHHERSIPCVVQRWAKAWNTGNPEQMAALFTKDGVYEDKAFQVTMQGQQGVATWVTLTHRSIKNARVDVVDAFRQGNRVAVRWNFSGTDTGAFAKDRPATGKSFTVPATTIIDLKRNKIQKATDYYNLADLLHQVGLPSGAWTPPSQ